MSAGAGATVIGMTFLVADARVAAIPVRESYEPLVTLGASFGPARARVRAGLAARLRRAQVALPVGLSLRVVEGHRSAAEQHAINVRYGAPVDGAAPDARPRGVASRLAVPAAVAPHLTGAAVDVTLVDGRGRELDMGTEIDRSVVDRLASADVPADVCRRRALLARALTRVGLVNCPDQWWHWSYGDRYWALLTGAATARYGPVVDLDRPAGGQWSGCVA